MSRPKSLGACQRSVPLMYLKARILYLLQIHAYSSSVKSLLVLSGL
jgi:hypothetical protein